MSFKDVVDLVNKSVGPNALPDLRSRDTFEYPHFSTGSFVVDWVTAIGGLPRGHISELHGMQSSGKTTCALMTAAEVQEQGLGVLLLDYEHSIHPGYAKSLGVNLDPSYFAVYQPYAMEDGFRVAQSFMQNSGGGLGMVIADSIAAMVPREETEGELGESLPALQARMLNTLLRGIMHDVSKYQVAWVFINQMRTVLDFSFAGRQKSAKAGVQYGTPGGNAVKFYSGLRLEFMPTGQEREDQVDPFGQGFGDDNSKKVVVGQKVRVTCVKNKCGPPWRSQEIIMRRGKGIDSTVPCIDLAVKYGIIKQNRAYFTIPQPYCSEEKMDESIQGKSNLYSYFEENQDKLQRLFEVVSQQLASETGY